MKPPILLVHGAWHAAWCWQKIAPPLRASGHTVLTPDLPGHGDNYRPAREVTFNDYVKSIVTLVRQQNQPVTLLGHSMAGLIIAEVAEQIPDLIHELIFLAAYIPQNQQSLFSIAEKSESRGASPFLIFDQEKREIRLEIPRCAGDGISNIFFNRCTPEDAQYAISQLQPQPLEPFAHLVTVGENYNRIKKTAIICEDDRAILPNDQRKMAEEATDLIISLDADHSAYFSAAKELTELLIAT